MFIGTLGKEDDRHITVMESAVTETERVKWTENLIINAKAVTFKSDTDADCHAMSVRTSNALEVGRKLRPSRSAPVASSGQRVAPPGKRA